MTLEEAIEHCYERAGENRRRAELYVAVKATEKKIQECEECANDHEQLAKWLEELKDWHIRKEMSKNGRCSIIVQGVPLFLTQGHIEALIKYETEQTVQEAIDRLFEDIDEIRRQDND